MPRPERLLDPSSGPVQAFAADLRQLRAAAGNPKYLQMARATGRSRTALSEAAGGDHLPTWETTEAFIRACGAEVGPWRLKWERVQEVLAQSPSRAVGDAPANGRPGSAAHDDAPDIRTARMVRHSDSQADILLRLWQEQRAQARQSENHRAIMTLVVVIGAVGGMSYVTLRSSATILAVGVAVGVCALGLFGALTSAKYYERFKMHMDGAEYFHRRMDELYPELRIEQLWSENETQHSRNYRTLYNIRLHHLWVVAHLGIAVLGGFAAMVQLLG
ncbi:helix-turn-helix domain-containing protein [Nocardia beijingensis]|uniref:helix-turn-helix domain-containing protein n=1 Tax=Nocardia beijingensis TaxID=95162 RepID=UPI001895535B|nr:helix-turn-helix transcriptional regulator [Nocardia beijingensis]MBF6074264.1 helix-turn-helix domain-containing protein [Nocardia beijingensis]